MVFWIWFVRFVVCMRVLCMNEKDACSTNADIFIYIKSAIPFKTMIHLIFFCRLVTVNRIEPTKHTYTHTQQNHRPERKFFLFKCFKKKDKKTFNHLHFCLIQLLRFFSCVCVCVWCLFFCSCINYHYEL